MSLLALEDVSRRVREGRRERIVLEGVTLSVESAELVVIYGERRSGRSTLLRIAAGVLAPDSGSVRFKGQELNAGDSGALGRGIGYVTKGLHAREEDGVLEQVAAPLLAHGVRADDARERAREALARAGAQHTGALNVHELSAGEGVRVSLARALTLSPALVVLDEPAGGVELSERDGILALLRSLTHEGTAVLASTGEPGELAGAHRALSLSDGALRGPAAAQPAQVVALRRRV